MNNYNLQDQDWMFHIVGFHPCLIVDIIISYFTKEEIKLQICSNLLY